MRFFLFLAILGLSLPAFSQDDVRYKKKTVINFDDDTITGTLKTPDASIIDAPPQSVHENLIRVRSTFRKNILSSVASL